MLSPLFNQAAIDRETALRARLAASGVPMSLRTEQRDSTLYAVVQVSNIPWDISTEQVVDLYPPLAIKICADASLDLTMPAYSAFCSPVHFTFDRVAAKTQSDLFFECSYPNAQRIVRRLSNRLLGTRIVDAQVCSRRRMLDAVFPRAKHGFWITKEEVQNILMHAKTLKSPYMRKCPQRPFESFMSILTLFPWANETAYHPSQVDLLFAVYINLIVVLQGHVRRGKTSELDSHLLHRLIVAGACLTRFTTLQKQQACILAGVDPVSLAALQRSAFRPVWIRRAQQAGIMVTAG